MGLYNMGTNPLVTNMSATQSVVEFEEQYYSVKDLQEFFILMGLPRDATVVEIGPNPSPAGGEANLDIQWIMAMAPGAPTYFWSVRAKSDAEIDHILTWCYEIGNYTNPPLVNSLSYGMTEGNVDKYLGSGYLNRTNTELQKLALQGLTIIIADGDTGANDIGPPPMSQLQCNPSHPDWPSDSAYVTAIGSTYITPLAEPICYNSHGMNCLNNPLGEVTTSVEFGMTWTTGGGFSNVTPRPSYQDAAVEQYLNNNQNVPSSGYFNASGRAYADAVTVGHNLQVVLSGSLAAIDGTSASAPIFGGIVSVLNNARLNAGKTPLGFMNQLLYQSLAELPAAWSDVTVGRNRCGAYGWKPVCCEEGYTCGVGWDPVSGAGSPNVELLK